ncbi:MAG: PilZ domain-containing protein, partial [Thermodesulfobacteriota bacterium]
MPDREQRRFTRVPFKVETRMETADRVYTVAELYNLGVGGCLLPLEPSLSVGDAVRVAILLTREPAPLEVEVEAEVVRHEDGMTALKFIRIDPDSLFHLRNIIRYNARDADAVESEFDAHP